MIDLPQGNTNSHRTAIGIPTDKERQEYERDVEAQKKGYIPPHVEHRINRYEHLYTTKRDTQLTRKRDERSNYKHSTKPS